MHLQSVELFAGCGGLVLGTHRAGFRHKAVIEWNGSAVDTLDRNTSWPLHQVAESCQPAMLGTMSAPAECSLSGGGRPAAHAIMVSGLAAGNRVRCWAGQSPAARKMAVLADTNLSQSR